MINIIIIIIINIIITSSSSTSTSSPSSSLQHSMANWSSWDRREYPATSQILLTISLTYTTVWQIEPQNVPVTMVTSNCHLQLYNCSSALSNTCLLMSSTMLKVFNNESTFLSNKTNLSMNKICFKTCPWYTWVGSHMAVGETEKAKIRYNINCFGKISNC